jgi:alkylation response protein AidB-like acyl-CoA dehydrogenase
MTTVTFALDDELQLLVQTVRRLFPERATSEQIRKVMATAEAVDEALWQELAGMGLLGLLVPEGHGGSGSSFLEAALVMEEAGRALAPVPYLSSAVLAVGGPRRARPPPPRADRSLHQPDPGWARSEAQ